MDAVFRATTPIKFPRKQDHATGFFYSGSSGYYLITNRHVVYDTSEDSDRLIHNPETLHIRFRNENNLEQTHSQTVELYDSDTPKWHEHLHYDVDVVAIPLDRDLRKTGNTACGLGSNSIGVERSPGAPLPESTKSGESAVVAGYPIIDSSTYAPVLRDALISSPLGKGFMNKPYFLIDAKLHPGTSGSPVFTKARNQVDDILLRLVGVHSGRFDVVQEGSENLNRVWYISLIDEMIP